MIHDLLALTAMNFFDDFYGDVRDLVSPKAFEIAGNAYPYNYGYPYS